MVFSINRASLPLGEIDPGGDNPRHPVVRRRDVTELRASRRREACIGVLELRVAATPNRCQGPRARAGKPAMRPTGAMKRSEQSAICSPTETDDPFTRWNED